MSAAVRVAPDSIPIRNCFTDRGTTYAARIESTGSAMIENCTFWGSSGGGYGVYGSASCTVGVRNGGGFVPGSYAGNNQLPPAKLRYLFSTDLHIKPSGNYAGNNGLDLSSDFTDDIDGQTRSGTWDIGADETRPAPTRPPRRSSPGRRSSRRSAPRKAGFMQQQMFQAQAVW